MSHQKSYVTQKENKTETHSHTNKQKYRCHKNKIQTKREKKNELHPNFMKEKYNKLKINKEIRDGGVRRKEI